MLIISGMKGWLTLCFGVVAIGALVLVTGCAEDSGWNAGMMGLPVNGSDPNAPQHPQTAPESPPGSGAVDYIPQGNY